MDDVKKTISYFVNELYETTTYFSASMLIYCIVLLTLLQCHRCAQMFRLVFNEYFFQCLIIITLLPLWKRSTLLAYFKKEYTYVWAEYVFRLLTACYLQLNENVFLLYFFIKNN